ncbi:FadR/GntR family transcriptional regulator [Actinomadura livida]|uniref:DNA-binding FadR family transcriptional regulator n=1 Tax=Actinomadura livida TaxID=79909 RepID=A0A7W7MYF0_9ACTN|nr:MULTISPECIES: FCD domain-containing protein [Actinomadura]MBB4774919.1 DNA-binding FadR family transcriptional regulator [Actinomadura catellatispora]GGU05147.1 GntR family transcriptional regulator [Actinomadura livida]
MSTDRAAAELPRLSLAEAVAKRIEARIAEEALPAGHRLGTRDSLRREFDVAAATFNETVRLLAARGTVSVRPGVKGGIFVASPPPLVRLGRKMLELTGDSVSVSDCLVVRDALEPLLAREAMRHRTDADIADLRRLAGGLAAARGSADPFGRLAANWALHRRIAEITPNKVLQHTYISLLEFVENRLRGVTPDEPDEEGPHTGGGSSPDGVAVHRELVEAIAGGDPRRLSAAVAAHAALTASRRGGA